MGFTVGKTSVVDGPPWSLFTGGSVGVFVSQSLGSTGGAGTQASPYKTLLQAYNSIYNGGHSFSPFRVLLRRGDTWTDETLGADPGGSSDISGAVNDYGLFSNYDETIPVNISTGAGIDPVTSVRARPRIKTPPTASVMAFSHLSNNWIAVVGLDGDNYTANPLDPGYCEILDPYSNPCLDIVSGGTGHAVNDVITLNLSNGASKGGFPVRVFVSAVGAGGAITSVQSQPNPYGRLDPANLPTAFTFASSTGSGTGGSFNNPRWRFPAVGSGISPSQPIVPGSFLVENCRMRYFINGVDGNKVILRHNQLAFNYANGSHAGGIEQPIWGNIFWHNGWVGAALPNFFYHNMYCDDIYRQGDPNGGMNNSVYVEQNLFAEGCAPSFARQGKFFHRNACIAETIPFSMLNTHVPDQQSVFSANVASDALVPTVGQHSDVGGFDVGGGHAGYQGTNIMQATALVDDNILCNSISTTGKGLDYRDCNGNTAINNIIYRYGTPGLELLSNNGALLDCTITVPGIGYTPKTKLITGFERETKVNGYQYETGYIVLITESVGGILNADPDGASPIYVSGISGTLGGALNGKTFICARFDDTHIILFDTASASGTCTNGVISMPYYNQLLPYAPGNSGPGTGAVANIIVGPSGGIVSFILCGSSGPFEDDYYNTVGQSYAIGHVLTSPIPGGSGLRLTVSKIGINDISSPTNITSPSYVDAHPELFPHPNRNAGKYADVVLGGTGHTFVDLLNAFMNNEKANRNELLTVASYVDYVREGFGKAMFGSGYASAVGGIFLNAIPSTGTVGTAYSGSAAATGGVAPYTYTFTGTLPPGLSLNASTGAVTGTPTTAGTFNLAITAHDNVGATGLRNYSVFISAATTGGPTYRTVRLQVS